MCQGLFTSVAQGTALHLCKYRFNIKYYYSTFPACLLCKILNWITSWMNKKIRSHVGIFATTNMILLMIRRLHANKDYLPFPILFPSTIGLLLLYACYSVSLAVCLWYIHYPPRHETSILLMSHLAYNCFLVHEKWQAWSTLPLSFLIFHFQHAHQTPSGRITLTAPYIL